MDWGTALHTARVYEESIKIFRQADDIADLKDYTRLSTEAATLLVSDQIKQYKAEDFENILINVFLALDYASLGRYSDALIEARRVNRKIYLMNSEGKRSYGENALAHYLSGILYEAEREWNDALIAYKAAYKALSHAEPRLAYDIVRMAKKIGVREEQVEYGKLASESLEIARKANDGELVVVFERGISPKKIPSAGLVSVPEFVSRPNPVYGGRLIVSRSNGEKISHEPYFFQVMDVENAARESLKQKWGGIIAKKMAGVAAKVGVGAVINSRTNNSGLGTLLTYALLASDRADTRSWNWLPQGFMIARMPLSPGTYNVDVSTDAAGVLPGGSVVVRKNQTTLITVRYVP